MNINVTRTEVIVGNGYIVNKGEYKINPCVFTFSQEYTSNLVKKAVFDDGKTTKEMAIINNRCELPYEVLDSDSFELRVYAYRVNGEELELVYSPTPAIIYLREGSYRGVTGSGEIITPTQYEQYEQALNDGLDDLESGLQDLESGLEEVSNVDIDVSKSGNTATVIITNRLGTEKSVEIFDGDDYVLTEEDKQEIINTVEAEVSLDIPTKVSQLENDSAYINKEVNNLTNYTLKTNTGSSIELSINSSTYVMTLNLKNSAGTTISTGTIDLPLETMVVGATYDNVNKKIVLTLKNGSTIDVPVADLISGLQSEITNANKLSADLVDDTSTTHKFTSTSEKSSWNAKYDKPSGGIPKTDLASDVQTSLGKADSALQEHQDISGKEDKTNKTGTINSSSTTAQYPNAKAVYDNLVLRDEEISNLKTKNELLVKDHVPIENTGTELQLTGTGDLPMELVPYGNNSQETTSIAGGDEYDSPSIEHESPVKVVNGEYDILVQNKNLALTTINQISSTTSDLIYLDRIAKIKSNQKLYISLSGDGIFGNIKSNNMYIRFQTSTNDNVYGWKNGTDFTKGKYIINDNNEDLYIGIRISGFLKYTNLVVSDFEITEYIERQEQTQTIDTSSNPLYSENDCYKYLTSEQATALGLNTGAGWYAYNEWGKIKVTADLDWYYSSSSLRYYFLSPSMSMDNSDMNVIPDVYCTHFFANKQNDNIPYNAITVINTSSKGWAFKPDNISTMEEWKQFITDNDVYVYWKYLTPTYTKITDTDLIASLEALKDMQSYYNITNISQEHSDGQDDMIIQANALKSLKAMQDEIDVLKQAVLNS